MPIRMEIRVILNPGRVIEGETHNLSLRGVYCLCADPLPGGTECRVVLTLSGGGEPVPLRVKADGRVVRTERAGMAIEFNEMDLESYQTLRQLVLYNADDPDRVEREFRDHVGLLRRIG